MFAMVRPLIRPPSVGGFAQHGGAADGVLGDTAVMREGRARRPSRLSCVEVPSGAVDFSHYIVATFDAAHDSRGMDDEIRQASTSLAAAARQAQGRGLVDWHMLDMKMYGRMAP